MAKMHTLKDRNSKWTVIECGRDSEKPNSWRTFKRYHASLTHKRDTDFSVCQENPEKLVLGE